ncbi:hypothetical protein PT974_01507 [Cladobotryum mycophilum]|uniref:Xylanolytic transcriptional activator regulatory domain-containing protein n=1 Tax=Cladobotryum mycophilum TaxID=491253 RepID=A0ABR0T3W3_9HYPO
MDPDKYHALTKSIPILSSVINVVSARSAVTRTGRAPTAASLPADAHQLVRVNDPKNIVNEFSSPLNSRFTCHPSERKIDQIEARLGNIESLLRNLSPAAATDATKLIHTPQTACSSTGPNTTTADFDSSDNESAIGGESGLTVHTTFASEFIERAVKRTSLRGVNPKMETALTNLRQFVDLQKRPSVAHGPRFPFQQPVPPGGVTKLPMPPMATVVSLLKYVKASPPTLFTIMCSLVAVDDFPAICRMVYFPTEDFSDATFVIVNTLLYNLFTEQYGLVQDPNLQNEYDSYSKLCRANLETTLANFPLFLSPKIENVQALLLGCLYAVDVSRPSVALHLITMAAWLCQAGHYHRKDSLKKDSPAISRVKRLLFWHVYTLDKGLGLRLGRSSNIPECDIDIPREFEIDGFDPLASAFTSMWTQLSSLQSRIYDQLYSPTALASPQAELAQRAQVLADECLKLERSMNETREKLHHYLKSLGTSDVIDVFVRGTRSSSMSQRLSFIESFRLQKAPNLLSTPFAPFFVLFCYVIETSSQEDLKVLQDFVDSLEAARSLSEPVDKLYRLCQVMCDVAVVYMEAKSQQQNDQNSTAIGDEFDMYLSQLGFMPIEDQSMANTGDGNAPIQGSAQIAQYADWFSGSRNMMGLLEEDLSQIDSFRWMQPPDQM